MFLEESLLSDDEFLTFEALQHQSSLSINQIINISKFNAVQSYPVFIIAEAVVNHNGDMELAKQLVDVAVEALSFFPFELLLL